MGMSATVHNILPFWLNPPPRPTRPPRYWNLYRRQAESIQRQIKQREADIRHFTRKEAAVIGNLNDIDQALSRANRRVADANREITELDHDIAAQLLELAHPQGSHRSTGMPGGQTDSGPV